MLRYVILLAMCFNYMVLSAETEETLNSNGADSTLRTGGEEKEKNLNRADSTLRTGGKEKEKLTIGGYIVQAGKASNHEEKDKNLEDAAKLMIKEIYSLKMESEYLDFAYGHIYRRFKRGPETMPAKDRNVHSIPLPRQIKRDIVKIISEPGDATIEGLLQHMTQGEKGSRADVKDFVNIQTMAILFELVRYWDEAGFEWEAQEEELIVFTDYLEQFQKRGTKGPSVNVSTAQLGGALLVPLLILGALNMANWIANLFTRTPNAVY